MGYNMIIHDITIRYHDFRVVPKNGGSPLLHCHFEREFSGTRSIPDGAITTQQSYGLGTFAQDWLTSDQLRIPLLICHEILAGGLY